MDLVIIPLTNDFRIKDEEEVAELSNASAEEIIKKITYYVKEGANYKIDIYKNYNDLAIFGFGKEFGSLISVQKRKEKRVPIEAPFYDNILELIKLYVSDNGTQKIEDYIYRTKKIEAAQKKEKYEKWKATYDVTKKSEQKKNRVKQIIISALFSALLGFAIYLFFNSKYQGNKIEVTGVIINTNEFLSNTNTCVKQEIYYEFFVNDTRYRNEQYRRCHNFAMKKGDSVRIKYFKKNPNFSTVIGKK